ncbi:hypothetical protein [uncultured Methanolobus sp.]|nr:hypothetical protein [uncultured Methanolobus sp.]
MPIRTANKRFNLAAKDDIFELFHVVRPSLAQVHCQHVPTSIIEYREL